MIDQAHRLRSLVQRQAAARTASLPDGAATQGARCLFVAGGKGGVGTTHIALNLGISLARQGAKVAVMDGQTGLGHLDLLCGLNGYWNVSHVLAGARTLDEVRVDGPAGIGIWPGASTLWSDWKIGLNAAADLDQQLQQFTAAHDFIIWDGAPASPAMARPWLAAADHILLVTIPELTAIADTYAWIKHQRRIDPERLELLVNRAENASQAREIHDRIQRTTRLFLQQDLASAGWLPQDPAVPRAILQRTPFLVEAPQAPISQAITSLAHRFRLSLASSAPLTSDHYFERLRPETIRRAA